MSVWKLQLLGLHLLKRKVYVRSAAWYERVLARPAVQKGLDVPTENAIKKALGLSDNANKGA